MIDTKTLSIHELQSLVWDMYKDLYNVRPSHLSDADWLDREFLENMVVELVNDVAASSTDVMEYDFAQW